MHARIWSVLTGFTPWMNVMKAGRLIRFDQGIPFPERSNTAPADHPLVTLMQGRFSPDLANFDAQTVKLTQDYKLAVVGRDLSVVPVNVIKWYTVGAIVNVGPYLGEYGLIHEPVTIIDGTDDIRAHRDDANGQEKRCVTMLTIRVPMIVRNADVIAGTFPTTQTNY